MRITVTLPDDMLADVDEQAGKLDRSRAWMIRFLLGVGLDDAAQAGGGIDPTWRSRSLPDGREHRDEVARAFFLGDVTGRRS